MKRLISCFCIYSLLIVGKLYASSPIDILSQYNQKLDSVVTYDSSGKVVKRINNYSFDTSNRLISCIEEDVRGFSKYEYDYDNCSNQRFYRISNHNVASANWITRFEESLTYGTDCTTLLSYSCEGIPESESVTYKSESVAYQYDVNGKIKKVEKKDKSGTTVFQEIIYDYDDNGKIVIINKNLENSELVPTSKIEYTYLSPSDEHFATETIFKYENSEWVKCMITTYDPGNLASGNSTTTTIEYYNAAGDVCINKEVRISDYRKNDENNIYVEKTKVIYYENNNDLASASIVYDKDGVMTEKNILKSTSESDDASLWKGEWISDPEAGVDKYSVYDNDSKSLSWSMSVYYKVPSIPTENPEISLAEKFKFSVYPNPVKDNLYITCSENGDTFFFPIHYSVYNLTGKLQFHGIIVSEKEPVAVSSLLAGSYIISFMAGEQKATSVFVKK